MEVSQPRRAIKGLVLGLAGILGLATGCGAKAIVKPDGERLDGYEDAVQRVRANTTSFLKESLAATDGLQRFTCEFWRQERLGPLDQLRPAERIRAEYRRQPLSVRFTWLNEDSEFRQCAYIKAKDDDKVLLLPRSGLLGLPPSVQKYPPTWAVLFGKSKFPITDFGPRRLMEKTVDRIEKAEKFGGAKIAVLAPVRIGPMQEPCFHIEIRYPEGDPFRAKLQDLYIHVETRLPVATFLWLPGRDQRSTETLDASYQYGGVLSADDLDDDDFRIQEQAGDQKRGTKTREDSSEARVSRPKPAGGAAARAADPD